MEPTGRECASRWRNPGTNPALDPDFAIGSRIRAIRWLHPGYRPRSADELSPRRALGVHVQRIDRLARGHEQPVTLQSAEADVGAALGQRDAADHDAVGRKHHDAVELGIAHAPAAPQIAVDVGAHAVGRAGARVDEDALVGDLVAAWRDVIGKNLSGRYAARFDDG